MLLNVIFKKNVLNFFFHFFLLEQSYISEIFCRMFRLSPFYHSLLLTQVCHPSGNMWFTRRLLYALNAEKAKGKQKRVRDGLLFSVRLNFECVPSS